MSGTRDDRKGRPYAINRRGPDTPGGVSLQNSLLAFSQLQEHGAAVTVGRSACGRPHYERWDQGRPQGSPLRDKSAWPGHPGRGVPTEFSFGFFAVAGTRCCCHRRAVGLRPPPTMHGGTRDDRKGRPYAINRHGWGRRSLRLGKTKNHPVSGVVFAACQRTYDLAPLIYEGGGRRPGGARIFAQQIF